MRLRKLIALCIFARIFVPAATAQHASPEPVPTEPVSPYVLHVYANLVQVPTLILRRDYTPLPPLTLQQINVRLDSGPVFHPTKMHIEGNEPISLAILLDASGDQNNLLRQLGPALTKLAESSLLPQDHISIYAVDCRLMRSMYDAPKDPALIETAVTKLLAAPNLHLRPNGGTGCRSSLKLWDAALQTVQGIAPLNGRKVLLLVSSGYDHQSSITPQILRTIADDHSIAIFGLRDLTRYIGDYGNSLLLSNRASSGVYMLSKGGQEDAYIELCESTGGLIYSTFERDLPSSLSDIVSMIRARYIIEFPRPDDSTPGKHAIDITIQREAAYVVSSGVSIPTPDAARATDPTTVPSTPSPAILGKRHPLPPPN